MKNRKILYYISLRLVKIIICIDKCYNFLTIIRIILHLILHERSKTINRVKINYTEFMSVQCLRASMRFWSSISMFPGSIMASSSWRVRGMSRRYACREDVRFRLMIFIDSSCSVYIGYVMNTWNLFVILRWTDCCEAGGICSGSDGSGKNTSFWLTIYLLFIVCLVNIISSFYKIIE